MKATRQSRPKGKIGKAAGFRSARQSPWTKEENALLGKLTARHWTKEEIALLGTRPDREIAPLVSRSLSNVRNKRLELCISFRNPRYEISKPGELALLGNLPNEEVARRTGRSLTSVRHART